MRQDGEALREARARLRDAMAAPTPDAAAVQAAAEQVKSLQAKMLDQRIQGQLAIRAKLPPEQYAKWTELRKGMAQ